MWLGLTLPSPVMIQNRALQGLLTGMAALATPGVILPTSPGHRSSVSYQQMARCSPHLPKERAYVGRCTPNRLLRGKSSKDLEFYFCNCFSYYHLEMRALCWKGEMGDLFLSSINWVILWSCPFSSARHKWGHRRPNSSERTWGLWGLTCNQGIVSATQNIQSLSAECLSNQGVQRLECAFPCQHNVYT